MTQACFSRTGNDLVMLMRVGVMTRTRNSRDASEIQLRGTRDRISGLIISAEILTEGKSSPIRIPAAHAKGAKR